MRSGIACRGFEVQSDQRGIMLRTGAFEALSQGNLNVAS